MTLQIRAIPRLTQDELAAAIAQYHDITNPGNPQTLRHEVYPFEEEGTMTLQIRAIPRLYF